MTDYRSVADLLVFRDGEHLANLRRIPKGCEFRYLDGFLESGEGPIALHLPKDRAGLKVEGLANLPTYFAGLLPEGVMFAVAKTLIGSAADDLFAVLAATGGDAIGDIEVRIPGQGERKPTLNLDNASNLIGDLLRNQGRRSPDLLSAIPGAQPKLSLGALVHASRKATYIAKFESPEFPNLLENEFAIMRLARRCGLDVAEVRLESKALVVKRFDRPFDAGSNRLIKLHVEDMLQAMDLFPNSKYTMEFVEILEAMDRLGVSKATLLDALRLYVFSYLVGNGDLHAKNVSLFLGRDGQWRLTPAYDLLSTLPYPDVLPGAERMALALADDAFGRFTLEDYVSVGRRLALPERAVVGMVHRTARSVVDRLPVLRQSVLPPRTIEVVEGRAVSLAR